MDRLTPKHKESDTTVHRGQLTKQGSRLVRWAVIEGTARDHRRPSRSIARSSRSSTTACAMARSAAWPRPREHSRTRLLARSKTA
jgi:transposase